jgi:hypothetical protein
MDVHLFDGHIDHNIRSTLSIDEIRDIGQRLCNILHSPELRTVVNDIGTPNNYDLTNQLNADHLIGLCGNYIDNEDFLLIMKEQLKDMSTGMCAQGRCYRLYQVVKAFQTSS